jgi:hypothetical protein
VLELVPQGVHLAAWRQGSDPWALQVEVEVEDDKAVPAEPYTDCGSGGQPLTLTDQSRNAWDKTCAGVFWLAKGLKR